MTHNFSWAEMRYHTLEALATSHYRIAACLCIIISNNIHRWTVSTQRLAANCPATLRWCVSVFSWKLLQTTMTAGCDGNACKFGLYALYMESGSSIDWTKRSCNVAWFRIRRNQSIFSSYLEAFSSVYVRSFVGRVGIEWQTCIRTCAQTVNHLLFSLWGFSGQQSPKLWLLFR